MTMADKIKKSNTVISPDDAARERASEKEHNKSTSPTSYRLPPDTLAQIEALRIDQGQREGRAVALVVAFRGHVQHVGRIGQLPAHPVQDFLAESAAHLGLV